MLAAGEFQDLAATNKPGFLALRLRGYLIETSEGAVKILTTQLEIDCGELQCDEWAKLVDSFVESRKAASSAARLRRVRWRARGRARVRATDDNDSA